MDEATLPALASPVGAQSTLPPEEKRRWLVELVVNSVPSPTSQRVYRMGVEQFFDWWGTEAAGEAFSRNLLQRFRGSLETRSLAPRTINLRLAAVRKLAEEAAAQDLLPDAKVSEIRSVKGAKILGGRAGNWLTRAQAEKLLALPDTTTLKGKRDRALLALFVSAGLWLEAMSIKAGPVLGKVNKGGRFVGAGLSAPSIYAVVVEYAKQLGVAFRPHDLRRTYGKLAYKGGARIEQIQLSYGHASLTTTERYLGIE